MNKTLIAALLAAASAVASPAFAGGASDCHFHGSSPASKETVVSCSVKRQAQLVQNGKIDKSWLNSKPGTPEQVDGKRGKEWKVTFTDRAAADKTKENLYMFFTLEGNFIAANFSGN